MFELQAANDVLVFEFDSFGGVIGTFGPFSAPLITVEEFTQLCDGFHQTRLMFNRFEGQHRVEPWATSTANAILEEACLSAMSWVDEHLGSGDLLSVVLINVVRDYNSHTFQFCLELESRE
ncbi:hypothetical protein GTA08_BOTSDO08476 [Botryosphaeria dothidea]|uniref:Uncharacterized protein n=1 Tax=Botryosphaeria dothidea TaxID=55169 RepID=A0A8H4ILJ3_9PEZI|nr:hypothetical protein GTA08_BOTSDO08476 [Botryosphaeria dothidea]